MIKSPDIEHCQKIRMEEESKKCIRIIHMNTHVAVGQCHRKVAHIRCLVVLSLLLVFYVYVLLLVYVYFHF